MFGYCRAAQGSNDHKSDLQGGRATYLKVWLYLGEKKNTETREREREREAIEMIRRKGRLAAAK